MLYSHRQVPLTSKPRIIIYAFTNEPIHCTKSTLYLCPKILPANMHLPVARES